MSDGLEPLTSVRTVRFGGRAVEVHMEPAYCYICGLHYMAFPNVPTQPRTPEELEADFLRDPRHATSNRVQTCRSRRCDTLEQNRQESEFNRIMRMKRARAAKREEEMANAKGKGKYKPKRNTDAAHLQGGEVPLLPDDAESASDGA